MQILISVPAYGEEQEVKREYWKNGKLKKEIRFEGGKNSYKETWWYENGEKKSEINYKDGAYDGQYNRWYEDGSLMEETEYKKGGKDGVHTKWIRGRRSKTLEVYYKDGKRDGLYTEWYEDAGKKIEGNFKNGKRDGLYTEWYENGRKKTEGNYKDGNKDGLYTEWEIYGAKIFEGNYKHEKVEVLFNPTVAEARDILQTYSSQIKQDMRYDEENGIYSYEDEGIFGLFKSKHAIKQEFQDYYKTNIIPRLETPVKYIRDEAIHWLDADWDKDLDIVFWTEGIWPAYGGVGDREFIYVVEMENGLPINILKKKMKNVSQFGEGKYKKSMFFKYPNGNCGYNGFVRGFLTYLSLGGSASGIYRYEINYNRYDQRIEIDEESSRIFLIPEGCKN